MSSKGRPEGPPGQRDRKRPAPTIDLTATEVAGAPVNPSQPAEPPAAQPEPATAPPDAVPQPAARQPERATASEPDMPRTDAPPVQPAAAFTADDKEPPRSQPAIAWLPPDFPWPLAAAAVGGVALTLAVLAAAGMFSSRDRVAAPGDARLASLEQQVRELAARPAPVAADPKTVDDLAARLARLETVAATPKPPVTDTALANRIASLEGEIRALGERAGVIARRSDEIASIASDARKQADATAAAVAELRKAQPASASTVQRSELEGLASRIAALERTAKAIEAQLGSRVTGTGGDDRPLRILAVASALGAAVDRGTAFAGALETAKAVAPDPKTLAPLDPFAKTGVPGTDALARELVTLIPALAKAVGTVSREGGILERLKANAEKIVRIRPIDEAAGDDPAAVIQRIETRAAQANVGGALAELGKLPAPARELAKDWIARVEARNAAIEASRQFTAAALAAVAKPSL